MSGDDKPSRFAMISEEMINPPELKSPSNQILSEVAVTGTSTRVFTGSKAVFLFNGEQVKFASGVFGSEETLNPPEPVKVEVSLDPGGLSWSGEAAACPRCKLGAFELVPTISNQVRILCLGCPPPAPTYYLPEGTEVRVDPYRCCRCGNRARITMTLSEVNLHCRACKQLTLHTRQNPAPTPKMPKSSAVASWILSRELIPKLEDSLFKWDDFDKPSGLQSIDARFENTTLGIPYQPETKSRDVDKIVERMRVALKLENFFDFAQRRRRQNAELVVQGAYDGNDIARGTGRTTQGILKAIAECYILQKEGLIIQAGSASAEGHNYRVVQEIIDRLRIKYPVWVKKRSDFGFRNPIDAVTYVDHTYNER